MKQLNDKDIADMIGTDFVPDDNGTKKSVRGELHLSTRIPKTDKIIPANAVVDFHNHTEQQAWDMLMNLVQSGVTSATVITGASGILKTKFQQWATESILSPYIVSFSPINNGSFAVKFHKRKN